jgi:hypothetical protein
LTAVTSQKLHRRKTRFAKGGGGWGMALALSSRETPMRLWRALRVCQRKVCHQPFLPPKMWWKAKEIK